MTHMVLHVVAWGAGNPRRTGLWPFAAVSPINPLQKSGALARAAPKYLT